MSGDTSSIDDVIYLPVYVKSVRSCQVRYIQCMYMYCFFADNIFLESNHPLLYISSQQ